MVIRFKRSDGTEDVIEAARYRSTLPGEGNSSPYPTVSVVGGPTFTLDRPGDAVFIENGENKTIASFRHGDRSTGRGREKRTNEPDTPSRSTVPQLVNVNAGQD